MKGVIAAAAAALRGGQFEMRTSDAGEHCSGVGVQDLLTRSLVDLCFCECLPGPLAASVGRT